MTYIAQPPTLDIDKVLGKPDTNVKLERRVVWNLLYHLEAAGFHLWDIDTGDEVIDLWERRGCMKAFMEVFFDLDQADVGFVKGLDPERVEYVRLIRGNGPEYIVSDWLVPGEPNGFDEAMTAFNAEDYI